MNLVVVPSCCQYHLVHLVHSTATVLANVPPLLCPPRSTTGCSFGHAREHAGDKIAAGNSRKQQWRRDYSSSFRSLRRQQASSQQRASQPPYVKQLFVPDFSRTSNTCSSSNGNSSLPVAGCCRSAVKRRDQATLWLNCCAATRHLLLDRCSIRLPWRSLSRCDGVDPTEVRLRQA